MIMTFKGTAALAEFRAAHPALGDPTFVDRDNAIAEVSWFALDGAPMDDERWNVEGVTGVDMRLALKQGGWLSVKVDRYSRTCEVAFGVG